MQTITFEALSTQWSIIFDSTQRIKEVSKLIQDRVAEFEKKFSRFDPKSLVSQFSAGKEVDDEEFEQLMEFGKELETKSRAYFTLNAGEYLTELGYGKGQQKIDFGGFGKGWLIDAVAELLQEAGFEYFLINAGGDIFATSKRNGKPWNAALEYPQKNNTVFGTVEIKNQSLAASSPFKRSWRANKNHLLDGRTQRSIRHKRSLFVLAPTAAIADGFATILTIIPKNLVGHIAQENNIEFLALEEGKITKSTGFEAEIF